MKADEIKTLPTDRRDRGRLAVSILSRSPFSDIAKRVGWLLAQECSYTCH